MTKARESRRDARQLWRLCLSNGTLDEDRAREVVDAAIASGRRNRNAVLAYFSRLLRLDRTRNTAEIASAEPLDPPTRTRVATALAHRYRRRIATVFTVDPELIAGLRVRVGSDVHDGTVRAALTTLEGRFS
jgi:F-type H+-transporting ATPase subunit delta